MPFYKDGVGTTPYYVPVYETHYLRPQTCERVYSKLKSMGINVHKTSGAFVCELTLLDIYNTTVIETSVNTHRVP